MEMTAAQMYRGLVMDSILSLRYAELMNEPSWYIQALDRFNTYYQCYRKVMREKA